MVLSQTASGQTRGTDFKKWGLSWVTPTSQLTQGRCIDSSRVPFHILLCINAVNLEIKVLTYVGPNSCCFGSMDGEKLQSAQKPDTEKEKKNRTAGEPRFHITSKPSYLSSCCWPSWELRVEVGCLNVSVYVYEVQCGASGGQGRRGRWTVKAGCIFVSRQELCFPWGIRESYGSK